MGKKSTILKIVNKMFLNKRDKSKSRGHKVSGIKNNNKLLSLFQKLSVRSIVIVSLVTLIGIIIVMGIRTYNEAANALMSSYEDSMKNTLTMSTKAIELGIDMVEINCTDIYADSLITDYGNLMNQKDPLTRSNIYNDLKNLILSKQVSNPFVKDIFLITPGETYAPMTCGHEKVLSSDIYTKVRDEIEKLSDSNINRRQIIPRHTVLEGIVEGYTNTSVGSVVSLASDRTTIIIMDINEKGIQEHLLEMQLDPKIAVSYISKDNIEVRSSQNIDYSFLGEQYTNAALEGVQRLGSSYVDNGEYLFIYSKLQDDTGMICVKIPKNIVIEKVGQIKLEMINLIVISCIVVVLVGVLITVAINIVTKDMIVQLKKVEKGDLTTKLYTSSRNEFGKLAVYIQQVIDSVYKLIVQTRGIIEDVNTVAINISESAQEVDVAINDINISVEEINQGGEEQAQETTASLIKMDSLSTKMIKAQNSVDDMQAASDITNELIGRSVEALENITVHSKNTIDVTSDVKNKIEHLSKESEKIKTFTNNIRAISEQTTILSFNASIEAARAGQAGRGFSVVAEEIKKLANISIDSSKEVEDTVKSIFKMTYETVDAVVDAQKSVQEQDKIIQDTKLVFNDMSNKINGLIDDIHKVAEEIQMMTGDRASTLQSLQTITSVSQEIAASTAVVASNISGQKKQSELLKQVTNNLAEGMGKLTESISVFKVE